MAANVSRRTVLQSVFLGLAGVGRAATVRGSTRADSPGFVTRKRLANVDSLRAVVGTPDGTIMVGHVPRVPLLVRVSPSGSVEWRTTLDLPGNHALVDAAATTDGGLLLGGAVDEDDETHAVAYKLDADRNLEWWTRHRNRSHVAIYDASVAEFEPGTYALAWEEQRVEMAPTSHLVALDADGEERWRRKRPVGDAFSSGSGVVVSGESIAGLRADGSVAWSVDDPTALLAPTADGGFVGAIGLPSGEVRLARYDSERTRRWTREYTAEVSLDWAWQDQGGTDLREFDVADVETTPDGGLVLVGSGFETAALERRVAHLLKTNADGSLAWQAAYPIPDVDVHPLAIHAPGPGRYLLAGYLTPNSSHDRVGWLGVLDESTPRQLTPGPTTTDRTERTTTTKTTATTGPTDTRTTPPSTDPTASPTTRTTPVPDESDGVGVGLPGFGVAVGVAGALGGALLAYALTDDG